jgi:hypothetical protein
MRWRTGRRSENVDDLRGAPRVGLPGGGLRIGGGGLIVLVLGAWLLGVDPLMVLQLLAGGGGLSTEISEGSPGSGGAPEPGGASQDEGADFVSVVLADTEDTWSALFSQAGSQYERPRLVLFTDLVRSACGMAQAAMGPFYCPADHKVYIDLGFYRDLRDRFGAPGDFAQAYVIAHEVGHHVQTLLGTSQDVHERQQQASKETANALSVRLELQADCYAGVWAHHANRARQILEQGDVEEGLNAAAAIGDDRIQRQTQGSVVPEAFTHGSSEQRVRWFRNGLESGAVEACDTFGAARL